MENFVEKEYDLGLSIEGKKNPLKLDGLLNIDKLLRLNPNWFINGLEYGDQQTCAVDIKDYETDDEFQRNVSLTTATSDTIQVEFDSGDLSMLNLFFRDSTLRGTLVFRTKNPDDELENYYLLWLRGIKEYLRLYNSTTPNTLFFRFIMNKMVLNMNPSQRKISLMLVRITVVEIFVILLIVIGYVISKS